MSEIYSNNDLDAAIVSLLPHRTEPLGERPAVGILIADPVNARLVEGASVQLELSPAYLSEEDFSDALAQGRGNLLRALMAYELIVADEPVARRIRGILQDVDHGASEVAPALIAVLPRSAEPPAASAGEPEFDGILSLPQEVAPVVAQLGIYLYAHRAFARRYQSALEELQLNRRIFRSVTSGISVADATQPDLPLVYVNPAFEVMTGYCLEEVVGKNCRFLQQGETDQPGLTLVREALRAERDVTAILKNYRKDGTFFWNELSMSPIRNRDGQLTHIVGIQMDVTARVEFEAKLRESEKLAAVGRLAASIAHEINNPLESITNLLYLAQHSGTELDQILEYVAIADKELQRVAQLTSQSLRFYKQSTAARAVRPVDMLSAVLDFFQGKLDAAAIRVERRERMAESIVCLESEVRQVLSNLVRNALDALLEKPLEPSSRGITPVEPSLHIAKPGRPARRLLLRSREATDWTTLTQGVLITIADTGSGISEETMQNLFTAFYTTKGIAGTGLGLWVSAEIVNRHQGRLRVRSKRKPGCSWTVFQLFLPYQGLAS